jgi:5-(carboxyamino)imidazole ribonucleotide mutase
MQRYALNAEKRGIKVIIAGAGGAAHLPGMVASLTPLPVIGVPITIGKLEGLDALLSIAQMPKGVPVATMAVDNAENAGLLAIRILALNSKLLKSKLDHFRNQQKEKVHTMNRELIEEPV